MTPKPKRDRSYRSSTLVPKIRKGTDKLAHFALLKPNRHPSQVSENLSSEEQSKNLSLGKKLRRLFDFSRSYGSVLHALVPSRMSDFKVLLSQHDIRSYGSVLHALVPGRMSDFKVLLSQHDIRSYGSVLHAISDLPGRVGSGLTQLVSRVDNRSYGSVLHALVPGRMSGGLARIKGHMDNRSYGSVLHAISDLPGRVGSGLTQLVSRVDNRSYGSVLHALVPGRMSGGLARIKGHMDRRSYGSVLHALVPGRMSVVSIFASMFVLALSLVHPFLGQSTVIAAASDELNFQARLLNDSGGVVPDGFYHVEFKLYDSAAAGASAQGVCVGGGTDDCLWVETHTGGNTVRVVNGYLTVQLGSLTSFPALDWGEEMWLSINIGGTSGPSWDGEMSPRMKVSSVPFAFDSERLDGLDSSEFVQLGQGAQTDASTNSSIFINKTGATGDLLTLQDGGTTELLFSQSADLTIGSASDNGRLILSDGSSNTGTLQVAALASDRTYTLPDADGTILLDSTIATTAFIQNGNSFGATAVLGTNDGNSLIFETANTTAVTIDTSQNTSFAGNLTVAATKSLTLAGGNTASRPGSPTEGMLYFDTDTDSLLVYANGKWQSDRGEYVVVAASDSDQSEKDAADYVADGTADQVEINAALTAAAGGKVILLPGTYVANATILIPNNTTLAGSGPGTLIELADIDATDNLIENTDTATGTGIVIRDLRIDGRDDLNTAGTQNGIVLTTMGDGTAASARQGGSVLSIVAKDFRDAGVALVTSDNNTLSGIKSYSNGLYGIRLTGSENNTITGSNVQGNGTAGVYLSSSSYNTVTGNTAEGNTLYGIFLNGATFNTVSGNTVKNNGSRGISIASSADDNVVSGNKLHDNGLTTNNNSIFVNTSDRNLISSNSITDSSCSTDCYAININDSGSDDNYLANNTFNGTASIRDIGTGTIYANQLNAAIEAAGADIVLQSPDKINILSQLDVLQGTVTVGSSSTLGNLSIYDGSSNTVTISTEALGGNYTVRFPTELAADDTFCLETLANCSGSTLQSVYNADADGSDAIIALTAADDSLIFRNPSTSGTDSGYVLSIDQLNTGAVDGLRVSNAGTGVGQSISLTSTSGTQTAGLSVTRSGAGGTTTSLLALTQSGGTATNGILFTGTIGTDITTAANRALTIDTAGTGQITIGGGTGVKTVNLATGGTGAKTVTLGSTASTSSLALQSGTGAINLGTTAQARTINLGTAAAAQTVTLGSTNSTSATTIQSGSGLVNLNTTQAQFTEVTGTRTLTIQTRTTNVAGSSLTISAGSAGTGGSAFSGGVLTLQGGSAAGTGNANGGNVVLTGGSGVGTGTTGLVVVENVAVNSVVSATCGTNCTITQADIDRYSNIIVEATAAGLEIVVPDPSIATAGRLLYITAADNTTEFTLTLNNGGANEVNIGLRENETATLIWNGTDWTGAGASSSTTLQSAYNNTLTSAGGAELVLSPSGGNADGLTIRNNATTPINGGIFEVQTSIGTNLLSVNNLGTELVTNGGSEDSSTWSTNWTAVGASTVARTTTSGEYVTGQAGAEVTTTATANQGIRNNLASNPPVSTTFTVSFTAKLNSGTFTTLDVQYSRDGGTDLEACTNYSSQTLVTTGWTKITCTITTDSTTATNPDLIIRQTDATARNFWIDNLSFVQNDATTEPSHVQIGGGINGGQITLFTLDRASAPPVADGNETYLGSMYYDTTSGRIQCYESDGWGACGSPPNNIITLTPEYAGSVLNGTGIGTMTADFCGNGGGLSVNTGFCASGEARNYYAWTSPQATNQTYSIYITYQLPETFESFFDNNTISLEGRTTDTSDTSITYEVFRSTDSAITECGSDTTVTTSNNTWQVVAHNGNEASTCTFGANDRVIFKLNLTARNNDTVYVSDINFTFKNQ